MIKKTIIFANILTLTSQLCVGSSVNPAMTTVTGSTVIKSDSVLFGRIKRWWVGGPAYEKEKMDEKNLKLAQKGASYCTQQAKIQSKALKKQAEIDKTNLELTKIKNKLDVLNAKKQDLDNQISTLTDLINAGVTPTTGTWRGKSIADLQKALNKANSALTKWNEDTTDVKKDRDKKEQLRNTKLLELEALNQKDTALSGQYSVFMRQITNNVLLMNQAYPSPASTAAQTAQTAQTMQSLAVANMANGNGATIVSMPIAQTGAQGR